MSTHLDKYEVDQALKEEYITYVQSTLGELERLLHSLKAEYTLSSRDDIRRQFHSLKGTGTSYGFPEITQICGRLEDAIKQEHIELFYLLRAGIEDIRQALKNPY